MSTTRKLLSTVVATAATGVALLVPAGAASADQLAAPGATAGTVESCAYEGPHLSCTVSHPDGIAGVTVTVYGDGIQGDIDYAYVNCLTERTVTFDPPSPDFSIDVEPCQSAPGLAPVSNDGRRGPGIGLALDFERGRVDAELADAWSDFCWKAESVKNVQACELGWAE